MIRPGRHTILRRLEHWLFLAAGLALAIFALQALVPAAQARTAVAKFEAAQAVISQRPLPPPDTSLWSPNRIAAFLAQPEELGPPVLGILRVPRLGITAPIHLGASNDILDRGIGLIPGTAALGSSSNSGLAAHRDGWFRPLKDVALGDTIVVSLATGDLTYRVLATEIVSPDTVDVLYPTSYSKLTLVTCHPFYFVGDAPDRFIVHAELAEAATDQRL